MALGKRKQIPGIPFKSTNTVERSLESRDSNSGNQHLGFRKISLLKGGAPILTESRKAANIGAFKTRNIGVIPPKSATGTFADKPFLKARDTHFRNFASKGLPARTKNKTDSDTDSKRIVKQRRVASAFSSVEKGKKRKIKCRTQKTIMSPKPCKAFGESSVRLPQAIRIQILRALSRRPLHFLDLHSLFGVSKYTIQGFVHTELIEEVWGQDTVGVRFRLTKKGKAFLKRFEVIERLEIKTSKKGLIRLKSRT